MIISKCYFVEYIFKFEINIIGKCKIVLLFYEYYFIYSYVHVSDVSHINLHSNILPVR
jgi:hypothetical protein